MRHEKQAARSARILLAEAFVIQCGYNGLAGTGSGDNQIAVITTNLTLSLQLVQDFLLIGIGHDIHGVDFRIGGIYIFFCSQRTSKAFLLIL